MKEKIYFVTGNKEKLKEVQAIMPGVEGIELDLSEIQELNPKKILEAKLEDAKKYKANCNLMVEDLSLEIEGMNGLPGPFIKWFLKSIGREGIYRMAKMFGNQKVTARLTLGFTNSKGENKYFEGIVKGKIVEPRGESDFGWDPIFIPEGYDKTFAEMGMEEKNKISHRKIALEKLKGYLKENRNR
jgi:non-canonical purine NTP pyrophosphatase (RdgB/HAM1 family)